MGEPQKGRATSMPTLDFKGKQIVYAHHLTVPARTLEVDAEKSRPPKDQQPSLDNNLIIHGDNLHALKALMPRYAGRVHCIYIDPPYNTGNEKWAYNDNVNSPLMQEWLKDKSPVDGEDLERHDKWLCMMWPRLHLLRELLAENGAIFVSIDDNEQHHLRMMMDEIFGEGNFIASIAWQKRTSPDFRLVLGDGHDNVLAYSKNAEQFRERANLLSLSPRQIKEYKNPDNDPRGPWVSRDFSAQGHRPNQMYKIVTPTGAEYYPPEGCCWKNVEDVFLSQLKEGRFWFGEDGKGVPRRKNYLSETKGRQSWTWWPNDEVGHTQEAKREVIEILGESEVFDTPKPTRLIERMLRIATNPGGLVLDSFAGSGTTAQAVLALKRKMAATANSSWWSAKTTPIKSPPSACAAGKRRSECEGRKPERRAGRQLHLLHAGRRNQPGKDAHRRKPAGLRHSGPPPRLHRHRPRAGQHPQSTKQGRPFPRNATTGCST